MRSGSTPSKDQHTRLLVPSRLPPPVYLLSIIYTVILLGRVVPGSGDITRSHASTHAPVAFFTTLPYCLSLNRTPPLLPLHYTTRRRPIHFLHSPRVGLTETRRCTSYLTIYHYHYHHCSTSKPAVRHGQLRLSVSSRTCISLPSPTSAPIGWLPDTTLLTTTTSTRPAVVEH